MFHNSYKTFCHQLKLSATEHKRYWIHSQCWGAMCYIQQIPVWSISRMSWLSEGRFPLRGKWHFPLGMVFRSNFNWEAACRAWSRIVLQKRGAIILVLEPLWKRILGRRIIFGFILGKTNNTLFLQCSLLSNWTTTYSLALSPPPGRALHLRFQNQDRASGGQLLCVCAASASRSADSRLQLSA